MTLIGLFDRDVFLKLICCNLWDEATIALGITVAYRLASTSSQRSNKRVIDKMLTSEDAASALERSSILIKQVPIIPDEYVDDIENSQEFIYLNGIEGIDGGEQVLSAVLMRSHPDKLLVTGDKRFIMALSLKLGVPWRTLCRRIISFGECICAIEARYGFECLCQKAYPVRHCDSTLRLAFGSEPRREEFLTGMQSCDPIRISLSKMTTTASPSPSPVTQSFPFSPATAKPEQGDN